jgi:hypothetical protein
MQRIHNALYNKNLVYDGEMIQCCECFLFLVPRNSYLSKIEKIEKIDHIV